MITLEMEAILHVDTTQTTVVDILTAVSTFDLRR
jgi:hypothetical protein